MKLSRLQKSIVAFLAIALLAPAMMLGAPKRAEAVLPTADLLGEKTFWVNIGFGIIENTLYSGLKFALNQLALSSSNMFMDFVTNGLVGRQPVWDSRTWSQFGIDVLDQSAGGAAEGFFLTLDTMDRAKQAGVGKTATDAQQFDQNATKNRETLDKYQADLTKDWDGYGCQQYYEDAKLTEPPQPGEQASRFEEYAANDTGKNCDSISSKINTSSQLYDQYVIQNEDKAEASRARISQFNVAEGDRFIKYQRDRAGALSPGATSILRRACNPSFGLEFNIGLGLAAPLGQIEPPICKVSALFTNWTSAIQGTGVAISDIVRQTGQNPWETLSDAIDPRKSNVGVALAIHQNIIAEQEQINVAKMTERWLAEQEGFKPVTDVIGNITTPAPFLKKVYEENVKNEADTTKRLTGKAAVDAADLIIGFVSTLIGNTTKLYFDGLRKKADEVNSQQKGVFAEGGDFSPAAKNSDVIYNPSAAPQYAGAQEIIARRTVQLAQVKTTSGEDMNILSEFQTQDCKTFPNACTLGSGFARAIQEKLTVGEAIKKYRESNGSVGLNPLGIFGYTSKQTEPTDFRDSYPYHSMVVLRKYRVLPVAWELAALYLKDKPDACSGRDCTLQDIIAGFNDSGSPFYRLIDPSWVLKLPAVRCELKGYGPAAWQDAGGGAIREQEPLMRPEVCIDERSWLHEGTPADWRKAEKEITNEDYGYCVEEKKVFTIKGTQCKKEFSSCDTFAELDRDGKPARTQFYLKDSLPAVAFATDQSTNVCAEKNAGCSWLSNTRRQYETCVVKLDIKEDAGNGNVKYINKRQLLENKTLKELWVSNATTTALEDASWKDATYRAKTALCGTIREQRPDGTTFSLVQEWTATSTDRVYLSYKASQCEAEFEGCRDVGGGDYLKVAPAYLKCDEPGAWQRGECQRYALHCTAEAVGCELYSPESRFESPVTATTPLACVSGQCVDLNNYLLEPSFFNPAATTAFYPFKASAVQSCNAPSSGCEEFTNLAAQRAGAEARTYFTKGISCEQKPAAERTVFYSYYGSEQGGRQPVPFSLKANSSNASVPDCISGYTCTATSTVATAGSTIVCDDTILTQQYYNPSLPLTCREFIAPDGTVSYRLIDKLIYQTDDCAEYRRSTDQQESTYSPSLSAQCAPQYKGCRTYVSTQAGNYKLAIRDVFDQAQGTSGWHVPDGETTFAADTSLESENVGGRSMRIQKKTGTPTSYEVRKEVVIQKDFTYSFTMTARAQTSNTVTAKLKDLESGVDLNLGTYAFSSAQWQYITFSATSSPANANATSTLSLVFSKGSASSLGQGSDNSVYADNIYLKEASGKTVYAIDTSVSTQSARPSACRTAGASTAAESDDIYQTGCQFYNDRNGRPFVNTAGERVAHYGFQNVCPAAFVGCKDFPNGYIYHLGSQNQIVSGASNIPAGVGKCATDLNPARWDAAPWSANFDTGFSAQESDPGKCYDQYNSFGGSGAGNDYAIYTKQQHFFNLVDEPKARCTQSNRDCTAYGYPKNIQEGISVAGGAATTIADIQTRYTSVSQKEDWQTVYYKITPEQIAASSTTAAFNDGSAYKGGICKQAEVGCKGYDTAAAKRYFKDPTKNVCQFFVTKPEGAKGQPKIPEGGSGGGWFYKSCSKVSDNLLSAVLTNALTYPYLACRTDADCAGLNDRYPRTDGSKVPVYTEKCDSYISCELEKDIYGNVVDATKPVGPAFDALRTPSIDPLGATGSTARSYWIASGPVSYAKQCNAKVSGCTEYQDPDCRPCGPQNEYCVEPDPMGLRGTLIADYGRYNPTVRGQQGSQCQTKYYYLKSSEKFGADECRNEADVENGCILFRGTGKDASALTYNSTYYYGAYFNSKRGVTVNRADASNTDKEVYDPTVTVSTPSATTTNAYGANLRDANVVMKANLDRACNIPLVCASEIATGDTTQCVERLPCLIENESGGCLSIAFSGKRACKGAVGSPCSINADCDGVTGAITPVQCVPVGVCNNSLARCTANADCGAGNACVAQSDPAFIARIKDFCRDPAQTVNADSCNANIECFWNEYSNPRCRAKDTSALQKAFLVPKAQNAPTTADLDLTFTMLSGYAHPNMQFAVGENKDTLGRDSFFDWDQNLSKRDGLGGTGSEKNLQNTLDLVSYKVANSCRLYPRSDAPYRVINTTWNDACNYVTDANVQFGTQSTSNIGLYGYCLEPYPRFKSQFAKQWNDSQPMSLARFATNSVNKTEGGSYELQPPLSLNTSFPPQHLVNLPFVNGIYNPYRYACLLWHPTDKPANQSISGVAGADIGGDIKAYQGPRNDIYLCVDKADGGTSADFDTAAASSITHYPYEDFFKNAAGAALTEITTRVSSNLGISNADITFDDAGTKATNDNFIIVTAEKSPLWIAAGIVTTGLVCAGSAVPGLQGLFAACLGTAAVTISYASGSTNDVKGFVALNDKEKLRGNGLHLNAIEKIEYTIEGARRDQFRDFFAGTNQGGGTNIHSGAASNFIVMLWDKHSGDPANTLDRTYYNKSAGLASDTWKNGATLYNWQDSVKKPVAFFFDENTSNRESRRCRMNDPRGGGNPTTAICSGGATWDAESFFGHGCVDSNGDGDGKNFVALGPVIDTATTRLKGWRWRYCDSSTSSDAESIAVSIKIKFKSQNSQIVSKGKNIFGDYCSKLVRPAGNSGEAVSYYNELQAAASTALQDKHSGGRAAGAADAYQIFAYKGKNFLVGPPNAQNTRLYFDPKMQTWKYDTWYYNPGGTAGIAPYSEALAEAKGNCRWALIDLGIGGSCGDDLSRVTRDKDTGAYTPDTTQPLQSAATVQAVAANGGVPKFPELAVPSGNPLEDLRTSLFGKAYEYWRAWDPSSVTATGYTSSAAYKPDTRTYEENTADSGHFTSGATAADKSTLETMWNTSKTNARSNAPLIYAADASSTVGWYTQGAQDTFRFIHDKKTIYQKVSLQFFVKEPDRNQLPIRKLIVDWGDFPSSRKEFVNSDTEGTGKNDRPGTTVYKGTPEAQPFATKYIYRDTPVGKTICIYAMDNWEAKSAVCGTIVKDASGNLTIPTFFTRRGASYDIGLSPVSWPAKTKGRCSTLATATSHTGVDDTTAVGASRFDCPF